MPQHDPNDPSAIGRPPFGGDAESIDDEDFWERARRTKKEDKKAGRRKWRDADGERTGRKASSARKRKTPSRSGDAVSFGLPPTGGAQGGTDYPVSPRVARARARLQGLPPEPGPEIPPPGRDGRGGRDVRDELRDRLLGRQPGGAVPPDPPRPPIPMPSAGRPPGASRVPPPGPPPTAPTPPVRPAAHNAPPSPGSPHSPLTSPSPLSQPPTAPTGPVGPPPGPPTGPGTPPLMSPLLAKSRLAGRRAQRSGLTGQTPAVPGPPGSPPSGIPAAGPPGSFGAPGSPGAPAPGAPDGGLRRPPLLAPRTGRSTGETPMAPPLPSRGRRRLTGATGAVDPRTPGVAGDGPPPSLPPRPAPRRSVGAPSSARSGNPDLLASPPGGIPAAGPLPSSRRRTGPDPLMSPPVSPPAGTPPWDPASTTGGPSVGRSGRGGRPGAGAGAGAPGAGSAAGRGPAGRRPGTDDPGATGQMPRNRTGYPASGRTPTGPTGPTGSGGPMLNATQPTPLTGRGGLRRPTTGSTPLVGPNTDGTLGPISAELPVVEPGPVAGVEPSPWEPPPVPRAGSTRPTEPRVGPLSGEVPVLDDRFENFAPRGRGTPPGGQQPVTTRVDLELERDFDRQMPPPRQEPPLRGRANAGAAPGTMTRRAPYDERFDRDREREHGHDRDDDFDDEFDDHDDDFDGSERQGCSRLAVPLVVVAVVLCIALVSAAVWTRRQINPGGAPGPAVSVEVVSGQSTSDIGKALESKDIITSASVWTWYVRLRGGGDVQAGTYEMRENMSMGDALHVLTAEPLPPDARKVTVAEGWTTKQLVSKLTSGDGAVKGFTAEGVQAALVDPAMRSEILPADQPNIEGTLFPETYNIADDATEAELIAKMVDQFDAVTTELDLTGGAERLGYSPYEVLTVASLIEEEAKFDEERPKVARVIYNRLGQGTALGIDATSCYDQDQRPPCEVGGDSPYDTRERKGLPPTPISSPGRASIAAALHPADADYLYYVRNDGEGHHLFTASYDDFLAAKQVCIDNSWGCG